MALDMESEFFKIAKNITGTPKNFHKLFAITPDTGRISMMGADGGVLVSAGMLSLIVKGKPDKAYRYGMRAAKDLMGALIEEFDEELGNMDPKKLLELGIGLSRATGWGDIEVSEMDVKGKRLKVSVSRSLESGFVEKGDYKLTAGYLAGLTSIVLRTAMQSSIERIEGATLVFTVGRRTH